MSDGREAQEPMRERLHDYLDGRLPAEERARFERALERDADLCDRLRDLRELDAALGMLPGHAAPADFTARVAAAARPSRLGRILRIAVPLAAAAGVLFAVMLGGDGTRGADPPQDVADGGHAGDLQHAYTWESDAETYGSLALTDLEDQILKELEGA